MGQARMSDETETNNTAPAVPPVKAGIGGLATLARAFKTDPVLENEGAWMVLAPGIRWKVRSQQSDAARNAAERIRQKYRAVIVSGGTLDPAQQDEQETELCALGLVTDWEGMTDDDVKPIACTAESIRFVLANLPHLRRQVSAFSLTLENYRPQPQ